MSWFSRLKNAVNSRRLEEDLADEMRDHREDAVERANGRISHWPYWRVGGDESAAVSFFEIRVATRS